MYSEPGSTVKHVKWVWPDCLVGNGGQGQGLGDTDRGVYNVCSFSHPVLSCFEADTVTLSDLPPPVLPPQRPGPLHYL